MAVPLRWEGSRTAQDAYIPLRPLAPAEAAALLSSGAGAVLGLSDRTVLVGTGAYLIPWHGVRGRRPVEGKLISHGGVEYALHSASWESYYNLHRVDRRELERALGRELAETEVTPDAFKGRRVSFVSHRLWLYAVIETTFLAALLAGLLLGLQRTRSPWLLLPLWLTTEVILFVFVRFYSPAFFDADSFHQRILVEQVLLLGLLPLWLGNPIGLAALCLLGYGLARLGRRLRSRRGVSLPRYWSAVATGTAVIVAVVLPVDYRSYRSERLAAAGVIDAVAGRLDLPAIERLRTQTQPSRELAAQVLDGPRLMFGQNVALYVPLETGRFLFLWRTVSFHYADIRQLADETSRNMNYDAILEMQASRQDLDRGFLSFLRRPHLAGRVLSREPGLPVTVIVVASDRFRVSSPMAWFMSLMGWRTPF